MIPRGNLHKLIGSWPSTPEQEPEIRPPRDTTPRWPCSAQRGLSAAQSPSWSQRVCTGVSDGVSECVTVSLELRAHRGGAAAIWRREERTPRATAAARRSPRPFICPPEPFYLSDEKQCTKQRLPAPFLPFPYCRARRGRGARGDLPPPVSPDRSSVESVFFALCHVCACVCTCLWKVWSMAPP